MHLYVTNRMVTLLSATMKHFIHALFLISTSIFGFGQTFTIIEKSTATKALFDYTNPLSLVSLVYNNASLFADNKFEVGNSFRIDAFEKAELEQYNISKDELLEAETRGRQFLLYTGYGDDMVLSKTDENFDSWYENQKAFLESPSLMPSKEFLKEMWDSTEVGGYLNLKEKRFFDVRDIDLLVVQNNVEDTLVHFAKKLKNYEKRVIVASIPMRELLNLMNFSVQVKANKVLTQTIWETLRSSQLKSYEECLKEYFDEPKSVFEQFAFYNGMAKINPIKESSIWERTLEFSTDLEPAQKMKYLHFGKLWECKQERPEILNLFSMYGEQVQIVRDESTSLANYLSYNYPEGFELPPAEMSKLESIWKNTPIGENLKSPLRTSYFWWDFEDPEMLVDYRFVSDTESLQLRPVMLYFVKDVPSINKKVTTMRFDLRDGFGQMDFSPLLEMNPKVNANELQWIESLKNPTGQCYENTLKDREKLSSYLLLSDEFIKKGISITLY